jgi:uncharacterized protein (PEP-CTERM system associated)
VARACLALAAAIAFPAWAVRWEIVPSLAVAETYTDNLSLATDDLKRDEWVTQVTPGIALEATGDRVQLKLQYAPELVYYARDRAEDQVLQRGSALGKVELAKKLFFVEAGGKTDQYNVSLLGPISSSSANATQNRTTVSNYFFSPYLQHEFGSAAKAEAKYTYSTWRSDEAATLRDSVADRVDLRLESGPAFRRLTWKLEYFLEETDYESGQEALGEMFSAKARWALAAALGLLGEGGYENYESGTIAPAAEGSFWKLGAEWTPTPRTRLAAIGGERFYGNTYDLDFSHRTRLTAWSARYTESVTSTRADFALPATASTASYLDTLFQSSIPDSSAREQAVQEFIARTGLPASLAEPVNFFTNQQYIAKRWQASVGILGVRNVIVLNAFRETREPVISGSLLPATGDFAVSDTVTQTGAGVAWNLRVSPVTAFNAGGGYSRNEFLDTGRVDDLGYATLGLTRQFRPKLTGALAYRWRRNDSNLAGSSYEENAVTATLKMTF